MYYTKTVQAKIVVGKKKYYCKCLSFVLVKIMKQPDLDIGVMLHSNNVTFITIIARRYHPVSSQQTILFKIRRLKTNHWC
jgi:hypothetical protein